MNDLALKRLTLSGWYPNRNIDFSLIKHLYANSEMTIPNILGDFFASYGFLCIKYNINHIEPERHYFDPSDIFIDYTKEDFEHLFDVYGISGMIYPVGLAFRDNMGIYMHESAKFYLFMEGGPLIWIGDSIDDMLDNLLGNNVNKWKYIVD